jgi:hypothetical protein
VLAWPDSAGRIDLWPEVREIFRLAEIAASMPEVRWTVSLELAGVGGGDQVVEAFKAHRFSRPRRGACWSSGSPHLVAILGLSETAERRRGGESSGQHAFSNTERGWWLLNAEVRVNQLCGWWRGLTECVWSTCHTRTRTTARTAAKL